MRLEKGVIPIPKQSKQLRRTEGSPNRKLGRTEKPLKIDDTPENVARALWGERSTKFPKKVS